MNSFTSVSNLYVGILYNFSKYVIFIYKYLICKFFRSQVGRTYLDCNIISLLLVVAMVAEKRLYYNRSIYADEDAMPVSQNAC